MDKIIFILVYVFFLFINGYSAQSDSLYKELCVHFNGNAKIEIGGYYAGIEMHHSSPIPQRISFYYPSANSIDLSTDYWKRDTSFIMQCGLKVDGNERETIGMEPYEYFLTPYSVKFTKSDAKKSISIAYHFSKNKPAVIIVYELKNNSVRPALFEFDTKIDNTLKTSHTYKTIYPWKKEIDKNNGTLYYHYNKETQNAVMFIANAGELPVLSDTAGKFIYKKELMPSGKMVVVQIIGTCTENEETIFTKYLISNYEKEIDDYERDVLSYAFNKNIFETGDEVLDRSVHWSKALLATSRHYIDGEIMPMPCPAEYNFFFTHDVLLTDLAAVNFDLERVKKDLKFITAHASEDKNIPHAYYWKDNKFVTEPADDANWNHFWFIIASASYLRHSADTEFANYLYPYISKSLSETLKNKKEDNLMWAYRPDWWDIGRNWGPRSFMTILAIQSIRDYVFISTMLKKNLGALNNYESTANEMQKQLSAKLWDDKQKYLMNYLQDGREDEHYYIGSLLADHFQLLDKAKNNELAETAKKNLLDEKLGIYTVFPMDFHKLGDLWKFNGNEAGDEYFYINGGIWPHGNSWYALALIAANKKNEACKFIKKCMTLDGIINSPNGQPAMYEYRNGKITDSVVYGQIDKPQFMWAAGWYMYSLYHLLGIRENNWNLELSPFKPADVADYKFSMSNGRKQILVNITGKGDSINKILFNGKEYPSLVIPAGKDINDVKVILGSIEQPYLSRINAELISGEYDKIKNEFKIKLSAFLKHKTAGEIISASKPKKIFIDGKDFTNMSVVKDGGGYFETNIDFEFNNMLAEIIVEY